MKFRLFSAIIAVALCSSAHAVIKVDMPVSTVYRTAMRVIVGSVTQVNAANRVVDGKIEEALKGPAGAESFHVQIVQPEALIRQVTPGQPVVIFVGRSIAGQPAPVSIHIADTWLLAQDIDKAPNAWRSVQVKADQKKSFPGTTAALVQIVKELKASGKTTLLDVFEAKIFHGGVKPLGKLPVSEATSLLAADVNGDGKLELIVGSASGTKVFAGGANGFAEASVDPAKVSAIVAASAAAAKLAGLDKDLSGNIERLTGEGLEQFRKDHPQGFKDAVATPIDVNGDGRMDYLILTPAGGLLLVNRGFGAYLIDADAAKLFQPGGAAALPFAIGTHTPIARADLDGNHRDDLLVLAEDGTLYVVSNPAEAAGK
jgi:hypothetical protein